MEPERYASILVTKAGLGDVEKGSIGRKFGRLSVQADALRALRLVVRSFLALSMAVGGLVWRRLL